MRSGYARWWVCGFMAMAQWMTTSTTMVTVRLATTTMTMMATVQQAMTLTTMATARQAMAQWHNGRQQR